LLLVVVVVVVVCGRQKMAGDEDKKERKRKRKRKQQEEAAEEEGGQVGEQGEENWMKNEPALQMIRFRNYKPRDKMLKFFEMEPPKVEALITEDEIKKMGEPMATENGIMDIAPKKANWDLKRDVARKLERLEKRTQRAIVDLIRDKVEGGGDLNKAIENRQKEAELGDEDED
jgi:coiled-coil domain-containing protein 12